MKVAISGITGKTGRCLAVGLQGKHSVVGGLAKNSLSSLRQLSPEFPDVPVFQDAETFCQTLQPEAIVDFTHSQAVKENIPVFLDHTIPLVIGTTGVEDSFWTGIDVRAKEKGIGVVIASNFSIGANLMMKWSKEAGKYFPSAEILETHAPTKKDAPSGTALTTARLIGRSREVSASSAGEEKIPGVRGGEVSGIRIHSLRLPAAVAHQSVIFSNDGEFLVIHHDALSRFAYLYGVLLALEHISSVRGVHFGIQDFLI